MQRWARFEVASRNCVFCKTLLFLFIIPVCRAVLVNRTIDSTFGDPLTGFVPIYQPQTSWDDQTCSPSYCSIQPDRTKAFDGTWNAATYQPALQSVNMTLQFTGVAVWVFFILTNANSLGPSVVTNTQVNITLDGQPAGIFSHNPDMTTLDMIYNATIFSTSGLSNTSHELVIATNDYPISTFINFDWAIYSVDDGTPASQNISSSTTTPFPSTTDSSTASTSSPTPAPPSSPSKIGVIVGCTLGGLAAIGLVLLFLVLRRSRRIPPVRYDKAEGILDIDAPPRQPLYDTVQTHRRDPSIPIPFEHAYFPPSSSSTQSPISDYVPEQRKTTRPSREARQREIDERIQSAQRELDSLKSARNARSAAALAAGSSLPVPEVASMRNEIQQLRNQLRYLHSQRESPLVSSNEQFPPAYTRH